MNGPILIDEINEHTTAAVDSIPAPPEPFSLTDLMIDGYERISGSILWNYGMVQEKKVLTVTGEGFINFAMIGSLSNIWICVDDKLIYHGSYNGAHWIGICYAEMVTRSSTGTSAIVIAGPTVGSASQPNYGIFNWAPDYLARMGGSNPTCNALCTVPAPVRFNKSFEIYLQGIASSGGTTYYVYDYYLKTGGGN